MICVGCEQGARSALPSHTCSAACRVCVLLLEPQFVLSRSAGESPGKRGWRYPGLQHLQWPVEVSVLPVGYEMLTVHLSKASEKERCCTCGRCPSLLVMKERDASTQLLCLSPAADRASILLPLVPLRWVVRVCKIHTWLKSLKVSLAPPWCVEAEFKRSRKLPGARWDFVPRPSSGARKAAFPSLLLSQG